MNKSMELTETRLINNEFDFQGSYMALRSLDSGVVSSPSAVTTRTIDALAGIIQSEKFESEKQSLFLYREACDILVKILTGTKNSTMHNNESGEAPRTAILSTESDETPLYLRQDITGYDYIKKYKNNPVCMIIPLMEKVLSTSTGNRHRAVAEALGSLPLNIKGPVNNIKYAYSKITFNELITKLGIIDPSQMHWQGRSLISKNRLGLICVIKFVKKHENPYDIITEPWWMNFLKTKSNVFKVKFDIPVPIEKKGNFLFKIQDFPESQLKAKSLFIPGFAIAYTATDQYFTYPNGKMFQHKKIEKQKLKQIFAYNARLLGKMASLGIIHTALIPLFHNRVQRNRREDRGIYRWERGGRLDQWLESCKYPNFAASGLRDFEHFISLDASKKLHHYIGSHFLSLILVLGSCFRNTNPELKGLDSSGNPVDARKLFDYALFHEITCTIVTEYYRGFTGITVKNKYFPMPDNNLIHNLIEKMGTDNHMKEILRVDDQNRMDMNEFRNFLLTRGISTDKIAEYNKGKQDISILTGPHLGDFSQRISVPDLIDYIFSCSALCISGRYIIENRLK